MHKHFKMRQKMNNSQIYSINLRIYEKNKDMFIHVDDLKLTDGYISNNFLRGFSYAIVVKEIKRRKSQTDTNFHLDIKVYLKKDFRLTNLPMLSNYWEIYIRDAIKSYLETKAS